MNLFKRSRKLAIVLAFATIFTALPQGLGDVAYAATALTPIMEAWGIGPANIGTVPVITKELSEEKRSEDYPNQAILAWELNNRPDGANNFLLSYPIANNRTVDVLISRHSVSTGGYELELSYNVTERTSGSPHSLLTKDRVQFRVYNGALGAVAPENIVARDNYNVSATALTPVFRISGGVGVNGFSFIFENRTVHFLWDAAAGQFYFATDGVSQGIVYDFKLTSGDRNPSTGNWYSSSQSIASVYAMPTPEFTPFTHIASTTQVASDLISLEIEKGTPPDMAQSPGTDNPTPQSLAVKFSAPLAWNETDYTFTTPATNQISLSLQLSTHDDDSNVKARFSLNNLQSQTPTVTSTGLDAEITTAAAANGHTTTVILHGLEAGQLFKGTINRGENIDPNLYTRRLALPIGKAYTLLKYTIDTIGNKNYVKVWPYENAGGTYLLAANSGGQVVIDEYTQVRPDDETVSLRAVGDEDFLLMPTTVIGQIFHVVRFTWEKNSDVRIYSQHLKATVSGEALSVGTPTEFEVLDTYAERKENYFSGEKTNLDITMRWDLGPVSLINAMVSDNPLEIVYSLGNSLSPASPAQSFGEVEMTFTSSGDTVSVSALDCNDIATASVLDITTARSMITGVYHYYIKATIKTEATSKDYATPASFIFPNVYFVNILPQVQNGVPTGMSPTPFSNFTLNGVATPELPPPHNVSTAALDNEYNSSGEAIRIGFAYNFDMPNNALKSYADYYLPELLPSDASLSLNFYISQNEEALNGTDGNTAFHELSYDDRQAATESIPYSGSGVIYMSGPQANLISGGAYDGKVPREVLRNRGMVMVTGVTLDTAAVRDMLESGTQMKDVSIEFGGLDTNQKYYVYSEIVITHNKPDGSIAQNSPDDNRELIVVSPLSGLVGITVKGDPETPAPVDKQPSAPTVSPQAVEADNATILWKRVEPVGNEIIEYEILRTYNAPMSDELLMNSSFSFPEVWQKVNAAKRGMLTSGANLMEIYQGGGFQTAPVGEYDYARRYNQASEYASYTDRTLTPNRIYYYYVRVVKTVDGNKSYSNWGRASVTTKPVQGPGNLRVEAPDKDHSYMNYNTYTETAISFETPVTKSRVGTDFNFYYQLKKEGEGWSSPVLMLPASLQSWAVETAVPGVWKYFYKIQGLEQGTSYTVRVFATDADGNESMHSNIAAFKTDVDQDDYDDLESLNTWDRYLREQLQKLLKNPYWILRDTSSRLELMYRPTMFNSLIAGTVDAYIPLYGTEADSAVYNIPISSLIAANSAGKGFKIVHDNMEVLIPAQAIDTGLNTIISQMEAKVRDKSIADYYVRLSLEWTAAGSVDGGDALTKQMTVKLEVLDSSVIAAEWDQDMFDELAALVIQKAEDTGVVDEFKDRIANGESSEELVKFVESLVAETAGEFISILRRDFESVTDKTYTLPFNNQFMIIAKDTADEAVAQGYVLQGVWIRKETFAYTGGRAMYSATAGTFVFTGRAASISAIGSLPDGAIITSIVLKYNLEDFFGDIGWSTLDRNVTRDMLTGAVARMAGAPRGADPFDWLSQNKRVTISRRNGQSPLESQEILYLVMSLYEIKTNTKVNNVQIRNYSLTNGMVGLEDKYKPHVRAAFELGLYTNRSMNPTEAMKVKDVFGILAAMDKRVKL